MPGNPPAAAAACTKKLICLHEHTARRRLTGYLACRQTREARSRAGHGRRGSGLAGYERRHGHPVGTRDWQCGAPHRSRLALRGNEEKRGCEPRPDCTNWAAAARTSTFCLHTAARPGPHESLRSLHAAMRDLVCTVGTFARARWGLRFADRETLLVWQQRQVGRFLRTHLPQTPGVRNAPSLGT